MAKWYGAVGYGIQKQVTPGDWKDEIVERNYAGEVEQNTSRWTSNSDSTNDDLTISNRISIVADPFAYENFHSMKYVEFMGIKWKITSVQVLYPRLLLTIGGVYNG